MAYVGTGGTLLGVAQTLKEKYPELKVAGVVPTDDPRIEWVRSRTVHKALEGFDGPKLRFLIEDILESNVMDDEIVVQNANAKTMKKRSKIVTVVVDRRDR